MARDQCELWIERAYSRLGNLAELTVQEMKDHISKKSAEALGGPQKIVPLHEVKKWITEGWLFLQVLATRL